MRIFEIAPGKLEQALREGRMDPNVVLSLQNVVKAGKITNTFEKICIARLLEFFKNGNFYRGGTNENNFFDPFVSTSKQLLDTIANLEAKDAVALATKLLELCYVKDRDMLASYCNATQENLMWIQWVTKREANEALGENVTQMITITAECEGDYSELCDKASGMDITVKKAGLAGGHPHVKLSGSKDALRELLRSDWQHSDEEIDEMYPELQ